jgi:outer membrane lipoprotein
MKRTLTILGAVLILTACAPVLNRELMREGTRDVSLDRLRGAPDDYKGKLFILGGVIVTSRFIETGTQIEALYVPVDSSGYLKAGAHEGGRFLAISPKSRVLLDPVVYKQGREVTLAGEFLEARKGKIDEMEYVYPVFEIKQIYLWAEPTYYYVPYYYPYYYNYPFMYDPWGRPYPYPYWPPAPW